MATLPSKRSSKSPPDGITSPKKSKAELKRQSISKAQQWAADRKRKQEDGDDDDAKKHKQDVDEGEERDVVENLPTSPARSTRSTRSRRSTRGGDDASHASEITESSVGSRRSSRRRTMTVKAASAASSSTTRSTGRGRKSVAPIQEEPEVVKKEKTPVKEESAADDVVVETKAPTPKKATPKKKEATPKKEVDEVAEAEETNGDAGDSSGLNIRSFVPQFSVFLYTIFLQWSIAFAMILVFFLDWFAFEFHPQGAEANYSNQRTSCAILGLWIVTIAGYSIVLGAHSIVGWVLATSSLAMAKFAIKMNWGESYDVSMPSVPVYSVSSLDITILDALIAVGFAGWLVLYFKEPEQPVEVETDEAGVVESGVVEKAETAPEIRAASNGEKTGPYSFIGDRVAVDKSGFTYTGTVSKYDPESRQWTVTYEASEGLDDDYLNRLEIASAFKLYSKEMSDRLKAMWRANEI